MVALLKTHDNLSGIAMKLMKLPAVLLLIYAVIFILDATLFARYRGGDAEWARVMIFVPVSLLLGWGLGQAGALRGAAWFGSLAFTFLFGILGIQSLIAGGNMTGSLDGLIISMDSLLVAAFIALLLPAMCRTVWQVS